MMNFAGLIAFCFFVPAAAAAEVQVRLYPQQPLIERTRLGQAVNFDVELVNNGARALQLTTLRAAVRDHEGRIVQRLELNGNGGLPGITTIADRTWNPGEAQTIFNPFHTLAPDIPLGRIDMEFVFNAGDDTTLTERLEVRPQPYVQRTALVMPMPGRVLVWDGHDFYSHHRRWDFSPPTMKRLGIVTNPGRYSLDLVVVDQDGLFHSGEGDTRDQHFSYGALIIAPGDGTVVAMANDASNEPSEPTMESFLSDPMLAIYGNYVVIDHGNGEFSQLGHLKQGSVRIRVGDRVRQGQPIAQAGASGTSLFPHLHYQLTNAPGIHAEGLPPRFSELYRVLGSSRNLETDAWIDSGDIIESRP